MAQLRARVRPGSGAIFSPSTLVLVHHVHYIPVKLPPDRRVPTFHRFSGFRLDVRSRGHAPPHFHVIGPDFHALIGMRDLQVKQGTISRRAYAEVVAWAADRTDELLAEWSRLNERD
jgi:hypothetical protein